MAWSAGHGRGIAVSQQAGRQAGRGRQRQHPKACLNRHAVQHPGANSCNETQQEQKQLNWRACIGTLSSTPDRRKPSAPASAAALTSCTARSAVQWDRIVAEGSWAAASGAGAVAHVPATASPHTTPTAAPPSAPPSAALHSQPAAVRPSLPASSYTAHPRPRTCRDVGAVLAEQYAPGQLQGSSMGILCAAAAAQLGI